ncbi:Na/Pi-cotransporter II-like protein [Clostridium aceticum]|uniref:Na/Pi-cotransporter II-like protein n=1 Tax=Clostridium aceticum TaxID=84022 RepID=A0A0D8IDX2_9CLOT|nr:Na/Pi cotransporter family protein [Clostridium aceticum]AKL94136.1 Na/Pi-cotransporter II-like protein [Clostridium aceticum]KJF28515.1 sodium-dependent phosphate transporter [Clostridium aceticum]
MEILFGVLGGLGLFLYGMNVMSNGLQKAAGDKLKSIIGMLTTNRIMAVGVGAIVTAIVQSSSASTVMVVGFVNAGMMKLTQAVGVIMGANIGTTITAQIITFKIDKYAPVIVGIAVAVWLFTKNRKIKQLAEAFIGFGILFIGMKFMGDALRPLRTYEPFREMLVNFGEHPFLAILAGFAITIAVQSSTASTGILLALAMEGLIPIRSGLPILFGINMGTTITAMLSSIGASNTAKRAAAFHFLFNLVGTAIFISFLQGPTYRIITYLTPTDIPRQIANAHTLFNITTTLILLPFAGLLVRVAKRIVPGEEEATRGIKYIDNRILETPSIATASAVKEALHMGNVAKESLENALDAFVKGDQKKIDETLSLEKVVNELERELSAYLVKLSNTDISLDNRDTVSGLFNTINDIERVGDHAENIAELAQYKMDNQLAFSDKALEELDKIAGLALRAYSNSLTALRNLDASLAMKVIENEGQVDFMEKNLRASHIERLNSQQCVPTSGVIYLDVLSNLERVADHSSNIAMAVLDKVRAQK